MNPAPVPDTPEQVAETIARLGGLHIWRGNFPAYRRPQSDGLRWHDCVGCGGVFLASELSAESGLCGVCDVCGYGR